MKTFAQWLNRKPSSPKPKKPLKRSGRLRGASRKRASQLKEYYKIRKAFLFEFPLCEVGWDGCTTKATECHHRASRVGEKLNDIDNLIPVCRSCHVALHAQPSRAREQGLLK